MLIQWLAFDHVCDQIFCLRIKADYEKSDILERYCISSVLKFTSHFRISVIRVCYNLLCLGIYIVSFK